MAKIDDVFNELDEAADKDADADVEFGRPKPPRDPSQVYSIRIPTSHLNRLRRTAQALDETPSGLMRRWVLERLEVEEAPELSFAPASRFVIHSAMKQPKEQMVATVVDSIEQSRRPLVLRGVA
jgi:hypothetical protein